MKTYLLFSLLFCIAEYSYAQGGIGKMPREDIVMLRATVRDSLSDEVFNKVVQLKGYALEDKFDSAAMLIAHNGGAAKESRWARAVNMQNPEEAARVNGMVARLKTLFIELPDMVKEYFAVFKDKDNPTGQKLLYQISRTNGKTKKMTSFTFYPVGDVMMLGEIN